MRNSILPMLLMGVAMPFAAFAQDAQPPKPDAAATAPASDTAAPAAEAPAPAADAAAPADTAAPAADTAAPADSPAPAADAAAPAAGATPPADTSAPAGAMDKAPDASAGDAGSAGDTSNQMDQATATSASDETFVTVPPSGSWRATDLTGKDVYGASGESIGSITDVLVNEDGKVNAVLVGVGGFLGIGQKDVAVSMSALKFGPGKTEGLKSKAEADASANTTAPAAGGMAAGGTAAPNPAAGGAAGGAAPASTAAPVEPVVGEDNLPDRIVLNVTREQLDSAPAFGEPQDTASPAAGGAAPMSGDTAAPAGGMSTDAPASGAAEPAAK